MEEVRSYWQVAGINHFCSLFQKPFKIPHFDPEELEQAFIIEVPVSENHNQQSQNDLQIISNGRHKLENDDNDTNSDKLDDETKSASGSIDEPDKTRVNQIDTYSSSSGYLSSVDTINNRFQPPRNTSSYSLSLNYQTLENNLPIYTQTQQQQKAEDEQQQDIHLLIKLAIALLKPHFNTKITPNNWENYLKRLVEANWVDLEHYPSPFRTPFVSSEGVELTKNLNFNDLPLSDKIDLFFALCDYRFWCDDASDATKDYLVEELRLESIGKDQHGFEYWYFSGTRLYREDKEMSQDLISRKKRIKELEYKLFELERDRIHKEQEDKKRADLEKARKLAQEAREARLASKRQLEEESNNKKADDEEAESGSKKRKRNSTLILPPRTGLRERRSSATSNNNEASQQNSTPARTTRGSLARQCNSSEQKSQPQQSQRQSTQKPTRNSTRNSKKDGDEEPTSNGKKNNTNQAPNIYSEEDCKKELESLIIKPEDRRAAWSIVCESLEEWEVFVSQFEKTKSTNERYLYSYLSEHILPTIRAIYAKRAAEVKRKEKELLLSLATRRVSTRIISKKAQEEEEERRAQIREAEVQKKKAEAELRLRAELEREMRARKNRFVINGGASSTCSEDGEAENMGRYNLRQQHDTMYDNMHEFDGMIHPDKLSDFYEALELIVDTVRTSKHASPFVDPVPETVPGYYDLIEQPMDLKKIRTKVEFREYRSLIELEKDFKLLINNCERFNGPRNSYTKMVYKLWKSFRKNVQLYLQRDLYMNEYETFLYPPQPRPPPTPPPPASPLDKKPDPTQDSIEQPEHNRTVSPVAGDIKMIGNFDNESCNTVDEVKLDPKQEKLKDVQDNISELVTSNNTETTVPGAINEPGEIPIQETIVEEIIYDTPDNEIFIWQDTIIQDVQ